MASGCREICRSSPIVCGQHRIGSARQQIAHQRSVAILGDLHKWGLAILLTGVDIGSMSEEQLNDGIVTMCGSAVERRDLLSIARNGINLRPCLQQRGCQVGTAIKKSDVVQWRKTIT